MTKRTTSQTDEITDAMFVRDGAWFVPGMPALGPWRRDGLHGGAVSALLARSLEREGHVLARVTMDLLARVPAEPLTLVTEPDGGGERVRRQTVEMWAGSRLVARARGLRLPLAALDLPPGPAIAPQWQLPAVDEARLVARRRKSVENVGFPSFVSHAVDQINTRPDPAAPDRWATWLRFIVPLVAGEPFTGVQRAAAAADYGVIGLTSMYARWTFMNVDLTVQLARPPEGEWLAVLSTAFAQSTGVGMGDAELYDTSGRLGRSTSSLLVEPR